MPLSALYAYRQFIVWKNIQYQGEPKPRKTPVNFQTGVACNPHDATHWTDFQTATQMAPLVGGTGVGFVLTPADPFCCIDLDNCLQTDGQWTPFATQILGMFPESAVELSVSGTGLHLWHQYTPGLIAANHRTRSKDVPGLEVYTSGRFIALGPQVFRGSAGSDGTAGLIQIFTHP